MQSLPPAAPGWVHRCVGSVAAWAGARGYGHEVLGDELLDAVPGWVHDAAGDEVLPVTDVGRLLVLRDRLATGHDRVVWLDADVVVFDGDAIDVEVDADLAVGHEVWVTGGPEGSLRAVELVCNAVVSARPGGVDDLLERTLDAARSGPLATRALGPDLLTVQHRRQPFATVPGVAMCSPRVVADLAFGGGPALELQLATEPWPIGAANLCASMATGQGLLDAALDALLV